MMKTSKGMGGHQSTAMGKDEWLTPPSIIKSLGEFDLDPCSPVNRPWDTAKHHYDIEKDGLFHEWFGRVWLNPPYGPNVIKEWMRRMSEHKNGIALVFARTETQFFQEYVFKRAGSILFLKGRVVFLNVDGTRGKFDGGAPSCLIAYGEQNVEALEKCGLVGQHVYVQSQPVIVIGISSTWKCVIRIAMNHLGGGSLDKIYEMVEIVAPDKVASNEHYKAKIRQTLQKYFLRTARSTYKTMEV